MKKLFGGGKAKNKPKDAAEATDPVPVPTPIHAKLATTLTKPQQKQRQLDNNKPIPPPPPQQPPVAAQSPAEDEDRWEVVQPSFTDNPSQKAIVPPSRSSSYASLPPGVSPSMPARPASPANTSHTSGRAHPKKSGPTAPVALGILKSLEPPRPADQAVHSQHYATRSYSDERFLPPDRQSISDTNHFFKEDRKRTFWNHTKEKEQRRDNPPQREREQRKDQDEPSLDLTRRIGYLTATASEDFSLVYDVCDRASASEASAKEAVRALRREFKYGEPPAQLSAARLWAIMLHNSTPTFVNQSRSRKFLETLEDLLTSPRTSPVVRERLLDVVGAAAYATRHHQRPDAFQILWRKVKPVDKPDEGVPFDVEDAMFNPAPALSGRISQYDVPYSAQPSPVPPREPVSQTPPPVNPPRRRKSPTRNRIIPLEEDIRRLLQECKIGQGNAAVLSQALSRCSPEEVHKSEIINEFYLKCRSSQELIFAQIPWATAQAERSRDQENAKQRTPNDDGKPLDETIEEKLLANLLAANGELVEALRQFDDIVRIAEEKRAEDRSRKDTRMDRRDLLSQGEYIGGSNSRSPSPSSRSYSPSRGSTFSHSRPQLQRHTSNNSHQYQQSQQQHLEYDNSVDHSHAPNLAPPPSAPHGPRSPGQFSVRSRTPSPSLGSLHDMQQHNIVLNGSSNGYSNNNHHNYQRDGPNSTYHGYDAQSEVEVTYEDENGTPMRPSAKALGKRKVVDADDDDAPELVNPAGDLFDNRDQNTLDDLLDSDSDSHDGHSFWHTQPVHFVYDAAAERKQQRLLQEAAAAAAASPINGVH